MTNYIQAQLSQYCFLFLFCLSELIYCSYCNYISYFSISDYVLFFLYFFPSFFLVYEFLFILHMSQVYTTLPALPGPFLASPSLCNFNFQTCFLCSHFHPLSLTRSFFITSGVQLADIVLAPTKNDVINYSGRDYVIKCVFVRLCLRPCLQPNV